MLLPHEMQLAVFESELLLRTMGKVRPRVVLMPRQVPNANLRARHIAVTRNRKGSERIDLGHHPQLAQGELVVPRC
jgi:hypothetical protein